MNLKVRRQCSVGSKKKKTKTGHYQHRDETARECFHEKMRRLISRELF